MILNNNNDIIYANKFFHIRIFISKNIFEYFKYSLFIIISLSFIYLSSVNIYYCSTLIDLKPFKKYIRDCKKLVKYIRKKAYSNYPYIAICIPSLNMENYIEHNLISILNQSFQNFEIIIVNDGSTDETENIIKRIQSNDKRIKLVSHNKSLGVYRSRFEAIFNSKSEYIILMDPDDLYLNENLFIELFKYNSKNNLDI